MECSTVHLTWASLHWFNWSRPPPGTRNFWWHIPLRKEVKWTVIHYISNETIHMNVAPFIWLRFVMELSSFIWLRPWLSSRSKWSSSIFILLRSKCNVAPFIWLRFVMQCVIRNFVFREGDLTSWTNARKLQQAQCWRAAQIAASFPGTIQWGFYHCEAALESRSSVLEK